MTEKAKRTNQFIVGVLLLLFSVFTVAQAVHGTAQNRESQRCIARKFRELNVALDARAHLAQRETAANKALWLIEAKAAGAIKDNPTGHLSKKQQAAFQTKFVHQLITYQQTITQIERDRKEHPVPPYPIGICGKEK